VRVDIRSETQVAEGVPAGGIVVDDVEYAEGEWVTNAETGDMEWHAADGSVISQAEWAAQSESDTESDAGPDAVTDAGADDAEPVPAPDEPVEVGDDAESDDSESDDSDAAAATDDDTTTESGGDAEPAGETKGADDDD
jgi:N utilization substance protein A